MQRFTREGASALSNIATQYNLSFDSVIVAIIAINNGGGTMAQFNVPELGNVQWMLGGMVMTSDIFNTSLQNTVANLCNDLANLLSTSQVFEAPANFSNSSQSTNWWKEDLGFPTTSGSQNGVRYAYFPNTQRLAVDINGAVSIYNTLDHQIGGVQQQQGNGASVTFTSQYGTVNTLNLPIISGPGALSGVSC